MKYAIILKDGNVLMPDTTDLRMALAGVPAIVKKNIIQSWAVKHAKEKGYTETDIVEVKEIN